MHPYKSWHTKNSLLPNTVLWKVQTRMNGIFSKIKESIFRRFPLFKTKQQLFIRLNNNTNYEWDDVNDLILNWISFVNRRCQLRSCVWYSDTCFAITIIRDTIATTFNIHCCMKFINVQLLWMQKMSPREKLV